MASSRSASSARCVQLRELADGQIREHGPIEDIETCLDLIDEVGANVIVSFGGGSPVDACKVLTYKHHERHPDRPWVFNIAVPTTLSAAEYSTIGGHTSRDKVKIGVVRLPHRRQSEDADAH